MQNRWRRRRSSLTDLKTLRSFAMHRADPQAKLSRDALHQWIAEVCLYDLGRESSLQDMVAHSQASLGLPEPMPENAVYQGLCLAAAAGTIVETDVGSGEYALSHERRQSLEEADRRLTSALQAFSDHVRRAVIGSVVHPEMVEDHMGRIVNTALEVVTKVFYDYAEELAQSYGTAVGHFNSDSALMTDGGYLDSIISESLSSLPQPPISLVVRRKIADALKQSLTQCSGQAATFLRSVHQRIILARVLSLDPPLYTLERALLGQQRIYLDTNVIVAALFPRSADDEAVATIVTGVSKLGCTLLVSPITLRELQGLIARAKLNWSSLSGNGWEWLGPLARRGDDPVLAYYFTLSEERKLPIDWDTFMVQYDPEDLHLLLRDRFGIGIEEEMVDAVDRHPGLPDVFSAIQSTKDADFQNRARQKKPARPVRPEAVEHDAQMFILIHLLREKYQANPIGSRVWLATRDLKLLRAQFALRNAFPQPVARPIDAFSSMLAAYSVPDLGSMEYEHMIAYLVQCRLGVVYSDETVSIDFLAAAVRSGLPPQALASCDPDYAAHVLSKLSERQEAKDLLEQSPSAQAVPNGTGPALVAEMTALLQKGEEQQSRREALERELESRGMEIAYQNDRIAALERTNREQASVFERTAGDLTRQVESLREQLANQENASKHGRASLIEHLRKWWQIVRRQPIHIVIFIGIALLLAIMAYRAAGGIRVLRNRDSVGYHELRARCVSSCAISEASSIVTYASERVPSTYSSSRSPSRSAQAAAAMSNTSALLKPIAVLDSVLKQLAIRNGTSWRRAAASRMISPASRSQSAEGPAAPGPNGSPGENPGCRRQAA